ncbi:molybdopterin-dependent oxidoreductase [Candidatus Thiosymbion oneisti]|uniref:molybdopterin-dependent oxidoreductase n=1 Tax=Candidatus Thiosymbion oneisti TaxID=589554 RepID=UPI000ACC1E8D|nr:molybdopterin-dependent oxidoreductase [Candidatus Thiosymbion oneisti]
MGWKIPRLSRRAFLKTTGYGTAGLSLLSPISPLGGMVGKAVAKDEQEQEEVTYSICNFCSSLCNLEVTTRTKNGDKRIAKIDGNPNSTLNRGKICARGQAGMRQTYDTDRLKTPMIRVEGTKRGEYKFREASWEEAWKYIEDKQKSAKIQPWEWTMVGGWTSCVFYMNWAVPFAVANQVPNIIASPMQHCVTTGHLGTDMVTGNFNIHDEVLPDFDNAKYILFVANNASIGAVSTCRMVRFAEGRKRGAKVVALDPRCSETAAKADEWIQIRPGTDLAFMLALMKIMMEKGFYDGEFLRRYTNMPFLVYTDDQGELRMVTDEEGRPKVVEEGLGNIRVLEQFSNNNFKEARSTTAQDSTDVDHVHGQEQPGSGGSTRGEDHYAVPSGARQDPHVAAAHTPKDDQTLTFLPALKLSQPVMVDGKPVKTVFEAQLEALAEYTPEWAAAITGIPKETIERISREFGTTRPAIVDPGWHGARFGNALMLRRVQAMVQALTGGIDSVGGWVNSGEVHHKAAHMYKDMEEMGISIDALVGKMHEPLLNLAGLAFIKLVIGAFSDQKGQFFKHGKPGWSWAFSQQEKEAGRFNVALPVMTDTGLHESVKGELQFKGEPYRTRAFLINAANPVRHYYPDTYWREALSHENVELVVAVDVLPSDTVPYADVILPNSTYLERDEPTLYGNGTNQDLALTTRYAAIDPLYDTDEMADILYRLTGIISGNQGQEGFLQMMEMLVGLKAANVKKYYAETQQTHQDRQGKGAFAAACRKASFNFYAERIKTTPQHIDKVLREKGVYHEEDMREILAHQAMPRKMPVPTDSGRVEFFSGLMRAQRDLGHTQDNFQVLAGWIAPEIPDGKALGADEFYFIYGKSPTVSHASTNSNNPVLSGINKFKDDIYKGVWMHPDRAKKLGIGSGDPIRLTNTKSGQEAKGRAYVTRLVHKDTLFIHSSFGVENKALTRTSGDGTATSTLIPHQVEPVVAGFRSQEFTLKVARA